MNSEWSKMLKSEMQNFGGETIYRHILAKLSGNNKEKWEDYWLSKQAACKKLTLEQMKKIAGDTFKRIKGTELHWENPQTFDEKIHWLMLYDATPLKTRLVDKYLARDYVSKRIGEKYLIKQLGVWDSFDEIDFTKLPNQFVLKLNSGSGMNVIVKDKKCFNYAEAKRKFERWMQLNFAYIYFEMQYRDVPLKIIAEEYIEQLDGQLYDYKIHCFNGKPYCCQVIGDRNFRKHMAKETFFDTDWNPLTGSLGDYALYSIPPKRPQNVNEMFQAAKIYQKAFAMQELICTLWITKYILANLHLHLPEGCIQMYIPGNWIWNGDKKSICLNHIHWRYQSRNEKT